MAAFFQSVGDWFVNNGLSILYVILILVFGILLIKFLLAFIKRQLKKTKLDYSIQSFICSILKFVLYLMLIFVVLSSLGISVTGLTVVVSAVSLAISLALQDSLKNLVNGFIIISTSLLKQGDWVQIGSAEGSVTDVKMLYTVLKTADNKRITIPNSSVLSNQITNFNTLKTRRLSIDFSLAYNSNIDLAKELAYNVISSCESVLDKPAPACILTNLGESSITLTVRVWVNAPDYWDTNWYLIDNIFNEFKKNNITIPFNQLEVALVDPNKETYVRNVDLKPVAEHKKPMSSEDDIISAINKSFHKNAKIRAQKAQEKKAKKAEKQASKKAEKPEDKTKPENKE